jgi:hypothetical protein
MNMQNMVNHMMQIYVHNLHNMQTAHQYAKSAKKYADTYAE